MDVKILQQSVRMLQLCLMPAGGLVSGAPTPVLLSM